MLRAFVAGFRDVTFSRAFHGASLICLTHQTRLCERFPGHAVEFMTLQHPKLETLRFQVTRHAAMGDQPAAVEDAVRYLLPVESVPSLPPPVALDESETPPDAPSATEFEAEKRGREVADLIRRLGDAESRAASLHYQVAMLTTDNRNCEMRCAALAAQVRALESDLRAVREAPDAAIPVAASNERIGRR